MVSGSLGAVSAGTFLYISTVEKIQEEFSETERIGEKVLAMVIGVVFVCVII